MLTLWPNVTRKIEPESRLQEFIVKELRMVGKYAEYHPFYGEPPACDQQQQKMEDHPQHDPTSELQCMHDTTLIQGSDHPHQEGSSEKRIF